MTLPTYQEVARSFDLWREHADPYEVMDREEFEAMPVEQREQIILKGWSAYPTSAIEP